MIIKDGNLLAERSDNANGSSDISTTFADSLEVNKITTAVNDIISYIMHVSGKENGSDVTSNIAAMIQCLRWLTEKESHGVKGDMHNAFINENKTYQIFYDQIAEGVNPWDIFAQQLRLEEIKEIKELQKMALKNLNNPQSKALHELKIAA